MSHRLEWGAPMVGRVQREDSGFVDQLIDPSPLVQLNHYGTARWRRARYVARERPVGVVGAARDSNPEAARPCLEELFLWWRQRTSRSRSSPWFECWEQRGSADECAGSVVGAASLIHLACNCPRVRHRTQVPELVGADHRADRLDPPAEHVERQRAD